jgi:hypothetical protein
MRAAVCNREKLRVKWAGVKWKVRTRASAGVLNVASFAAFGTRKRFLTPFSAHSNVAITSGYLHVVVDEDEGVGELFGV